MKSKNTQELTDTQLVFALAAHAWHENQGFVKQAQYDEQGQLVRKANKQLVNTYLQTGRQPTERDHDMATAVRAYCRTMTFKALTVASLSDFEQSLLKLADADQLDTADTGPGRFNVGVAAAAVNSYHQHLARQEVSDRLRATLGQPLAREGESVITNIEVLASRFSERWQCWYLTAVTDSNHAVWFSYREALPAGHRAVLRGRVKRVHTDGECQLTRVRLTTPVNPTTP